MIARLKGGYPLMDAGRVSLSLQLLQQPGQYDSGAKRALGQLTSRA